MGASAIPLLICLSLIAPAVALGSARGPQKDAAFEGSAAWQKMDLRLRVAFRDALAAGDRKAPLECLLKTVRPVSSDDRAVLASAGFVTRTVIGAILTGSVKAGDLPAVAGLDFVQAMELAAPMSIKKKSGGP